MANTVRIKRSTGSSAPTSLANAELAFAEGSKTLFIGIGTGGAGGSATTIEPIGGEGKFFDKDTTVNANTILAGPTSGSAAAPTFRSAVADDIPSLLHTKISDFLSLEIYRYNLTNVITLNFLFKIKLKQLNFKIAKL